MIKGIFRASLALALYALLSVGSTMASQSNDLPSLEPNNETDLIDDDGFVAECLSEIFSKGQGNSEEGNIVNFLVTRSDKLGYVLRLDFQKEGQKQYANRIICWRSPNGDLRVMYANMVKPLTKPE